MALSGCLGRILPTVLPTEHRVLLVTPDDGGALVLLPDDDSAYEYFETQVLGQSYPSELVALFENTTAAFLATNKMTPLVQTLANKPVIVLDSPHSGALTELSVINAQAPIKIELGIGLGPGTADDPALAQAGLVAGSAPALLQLAGLKPSAAYSEAGWIPADQPTTAELAFWEGWTIALQAEHARQRPEIVAAALADSDSLPQRDMVRRYERTPANGFRSDALSTEDTWRTPGVVGTFLYRLLHVTGPNYPQQHMLWMCNYASEQTPYAKILLAINRLPDKRSVSAQAFVATYIETYPAERESVLALAQAVFGK